MSLPKTTDAWVAQTADKEKGIRGNLKLEKDKPLPKLGESDVLVQIQAVSLNYRDLIIPQVRLSPLRYSMPQHPD
jgi:NADPH:quinone reductase-like Zn-dependent oxidoreductase